MADTHRSHGRTASRYGVTAEEQTPAGQYLGMVMAALADLPAAEIAEDIGPQLDELADELGARVSIETLVERLGTPDRYAEELRAAAGYPTVGPSRQSRLLSGLAWFSLAAGSRCRSPDGR